MTIIQVVLALLQLLNMWFRTKVEKDNELKKKKEVILKEAQDALASKDGSAITMALDRINRL
jgi:hypothetical protein